MWVHSRRLLCNTRVFSSSAKKKENVEKIPKRKGEYIYGVAPCLATLLAKRRKIHTVLMKKDFKVNSRDLKQVTIEKIYAHSRQHDAKIHYVSKEKLERISGKNAHQGIAMDVESLEFRTFREDFYKISKEEQASVPVRLALDGIHDPMNFGAILRCAYYLGVDKVVVGKGNCLLSPVVSKASAGVMELMPIYSVNNIAAFLQESCVHGWDVVATSDPKVFDQTTDARVYSCSEYHLQNPTIIVIGNEGYGVSEAIKRECSVMLSIPPYRHLPHTFDSLNVAVATGIVLHSLQVNKSRT